MRPMLRTDFAELLLDLSEGRRPRKFKPSVDTALVERAADSAAGLSQRLGGRQIQIRKSFVRRAAGDRPLPPSAALASSTSEVHIKMQLVLLWISAGKGRDTKYATMTPRDLRVLDGRCQAGVPFIEDDDRGRALLLDTDPYVAKFSPTAYAKLLGLPKPKTAGSARVRRSLDELASHKLIWVDRANGAQPRTQLRREDGSGKPYSLPGEKITVDSDDGRQRRVAEGKYMTVPPTLFTRGWAAVLTARALAAFLALLVQHDLDPHKPTFISPSIRDDRFGLKPDSLYRGAAELAFYELVRHQPAPVQADDWDASRGRVRHAFTPLPSALSHDPLTLLD
jgi:hypothetical protein